MHYSWILPSILFLALPRSWFGPMERFPLGRGENAVPAATVVSSSPEVMNAGRALGPSSFPICFDCFALIREGELTVEFSAPPETPFPRRIEINCVDEAYRGARFSPGVYDVESSDNLRDWHRLGTARGSAQFELSSGQAWPRYVRIRVSKSGHESENAARIDSLQLVI